MIEEFILCYNAQFIGACHSAPACGVVLLPQTVWWYQLIFDCLLRRREPYLYQHLLTSGCLSMIKEAQITRTPSVLYTDIALKLEDSG